MKSLVIRAIALAAGVSTLGAVAHPQQPPTQQKETPPAPGTPKNFRVPPSTTFTLPNGMQVTMVPFGRVPKVTMDLQVRTGRIDEGPNEVALSAVMGDMLREGTATRTAQDISGQVADMGGSLDVFTSDEIVSISGTVLSDFSAGLVRLMADV